MGVGGGAGIRVQLLQLFHRLDSEGGGRVPQAQHVGGDVEEHGGDGGVAVGDVAKERPEDRPCGARELVDEACFLGDLQQTQPERHDADEPDGEGDGVAGALDRPGADRLRVAVQHRRDERGDEEDDEDDVHPQRAWHETASGANLSAVARTARCGGQDLRSPARAPTRVSGRVVP